MANLNAAIALADRVYVDDNSVEGAEAAFCERTSAGSASQRNAERSGLRVAYTRTEWQRLVPT
jgi:hypothetical protein